MINVLFVESSFTGGGSSESLYQHLRAIDRDRIQPSVVFLNSNRYVQIIKELGIQVHVLTDLLLSHHAPRRTHTLALKLKGAARRLEGLIPSAQLTALRLIHRPLVNKIIHLVKDQAIDLLHLNVQVHRDLFGLFVAEKTGVPCISHLRSTNPMTGFQFTQELARYADSMVSVYVANSSMTGESWLEKGIDPRKLRIIHNGVPTQIIHPVDIRQTWGIGDRASYIIGCVASLRNRLKVDEFLLRRFAHLLKVAPDGVLLVVGDGPMKAELERESARLGIDENVIFTGFQKNTMGILAALDVAVEMSTYDSFSRVAIETMQAGAPLVANDVGGIRELVRDGENGLLVKYGDSDSFATTILRLLGDEGLQARLVENGRKTIEDRFTVERYASSIEEIYTELVNIGGSEGCRCPAKMSG